MRGNEYIQSWIVQVLNLDGTLKVHNILPDRQDDHNGLNRIQLDSVRPATTVLSAYMHRLRS